jgi:hypothetical protein
MAHALQIASLFDNLNHNKLKTNANYKAAYNNLVRNWYTTQNKFQFLITIEKALNNTNVNKPRIKKALKSTDWNLIRKNANYMALYKRVANKADKLKIINFVIPESWNIRTRQQQGATCWFHAIINGLLLSPRPRALMKQLVAHVPEIRVNSDVCPSKKASKEWFLGYIKHRLQGSGKVHKVFKNINVIHAAGFRRGLSSVTGQRSILSAINTRSWVGGTYSDFVWFYKTFFPGEFTNKNGASTPLFVVKRFGKFSGSANPEVPHSLIRNGVKYELTHGWLSFWIKPIQGHSVTGYISNGSYIVYDSATGKDYYFDWTKAAPVTPMAVIYKRDWNENIGGLVVDAVYMKKQ